MSPPVEDISSLSGVVVSSIIYIATIIRITVVTDMYCVTITECGSVTTIIVYRLIPICLLRIIFPLLVDRVNPGSGVVLITT